MPKQKRYCYFATKKKKKRNGTVSKYGFDIINVGYVWCYGACNCGPL